MAIGLGNASAAIVQHVPSAAVDKFTQWQRDVTAVAQDFAGFQGTDVYPPAGGQAGEWVAVIHFDDDESLRQWLESSTRARWVGKLRAEIGEFEVRSLAGGFSQWFAGVSRSADHAPAGWKMFVTVLLGLYPTVMLLTMFVGPFTSGWGLAGSMLIGNALSVAILQWMVMPALTKLLGPWLESNSGRGKAFSLGGLSLLLFVLALMMVLFQRATS